MGDQVEGEQWPREIRWEAVAVAQIRMTVAWSRQWVEVAKMNLRDLQEPKQR